MKKGTSRLRLNALGLLMGLVLLKIFQCVKYVHLIHMLMSLEALPAFHARDTIYTTSSNGATSTEDCIGKYNITYHNNNNRF